MRPGARRNEGRARRDGRRTSVRVRGRRPRLPRGGVYMGRRPDPVASPRGRSAAPLHRPPGTAAGAAPRQLLDFARDRGAERQARPRGTRAPAPWIRAERLRPACRLDGQRLPNSAGPKRGAPPRPRTRRRRGSACCRRPSPRSSRRRRTASTTITRQRIPGVVEERVEHRRRQRQQVERRQARRDAVAVAAARDVDHHDVLSVSIAAPISFSASRRWVTVASASKQRAALLTSDTGPPVGAVGSSSACRPRRARPASTPSARRRRSRRSRDR